jgi:cellulose synthase/poly-beta-1,6-N-acetylglucosamine synthase-like glycosyltransferase
MPRLLAGSLGLVVYVFAGYPALIALLARVRPRPVQRDARHRPTVSLIVVAYNEAAVIEQKLRNCAELDYPGDRLELIVVADGSDDGSPDRLRDRPGVRLLFEPERRGKLMAMNRAARHARHEILVFSDANNLYSRDALLELVAPLADPAVGVVTGRKTIAYDTGRPLDEAESLYWRYESQIKAWENEAGSVTGVAGEILAFRRDAYPELSAGTLNDDFVQAMTAAANGWRVAYAPSAISVERASATIELEAVRRARLVTGRLQALSQILGPLASRDPQLAWQVVSHKGLRPLVPALLLAGMLGSASLGRRSRWGRTIVAGQTVFAGAALAGWRGEHTGRRHRLTHLPYYFVHMNVATVRGIRDFAAGRREAVWQRVERG